MSSQKAQKKSEDRDPQSRKPSGENGSPKKGEESLDHTIEDSFPASDPPSSIPDPNDEEAA